MKNNFLGFLLILLIGLANSSFGQMCPATPGSEKITNGDFEAGNTGFTNDFANCALPCSSLPGDQYVVSTNPNNHNSGYFKNMQDHTPGAGTNMLVFDFNNNSPNDAIYETTVTVEAGKTYFFSAWFANISINNLSPDGTYIINSPQLEFRITGSGGNPTVTSPIVKVDSLTNDWNQYFQTYVASANGSVTIEIVNLRGGNQSNDLAIDDISFTDGCDKITDLSTVGESSALPDTVLNCNVSFAYTLDPGLPGSYGYEWKNSSGTILGTSTTYDVPPTPADGTKIYLCYETIVGCPRTDSVLFRVTPLDVNLGSDKVLCAPVNYTIASGVSSPPVNVTWRKDGVIIPGETSPSYTATEAGTYRIDVSRTGCGSDFDEITITNPVSSFAGEGTYCASNNRGIFSVTSGTTQVKWYTVPTGGTALNPGDTDPTIDAGYSSTNTTVPGCASGLYAEDVSSYPGILRPGTTAHTTSCPAGSRTQFSGTASTFIEINQSVTINSVDFWQLTGWANPSTYTFSIFNNTPTGGPYCGGCSPTGNYNGPTGSAIYSVTSASLSTATDVVRTLATDVTLAPGKYWFTLNSSGGAMGFFDCTHTYAAGSNIWSSPVPDNTGNNVMSHIGGLKDGNNNGAGALFNMQFQVGSNNACSRLFICASEDCLTPVEFLSFIIKKYEDGNFLLWKTASENNSAYFIIQRSTDGINFESIGTIPAAGKSANIISYNYLDNTNIPAVPVLYYRLKEVDADGSFMYSEIKSVSQDRASGSITIYPVPVKNGGNLSFSFVNDADETIVVEILNTMGQILISKEYPVRSGSNLLEMALADVFSGVYYLRIAGHSTKASKFLVE